MAYPASADVPKRPTRPVSTIVPMPPTTVTADEARPTPMISANRRCCRPRPPSEGTKPSRPPQIARADKASDTAEAAMPAAATPARPQPGQPPMPSPSNAANGT